MINYSIVMDIESHLLRLLFNKILSLDIMLIEYELFDRYKRSTYT